MVGNTPTVAVSQGSSNAKGVEGVGGRGPKQPDFIAAHPGGQGRSHGRRDSGAS
jgi:hypothetical protein